MKRIRKLVLSVLLTFTLAGCSGKASDKTKPTITGPEKIEDVYIGQKVTLPDVTVNDAKDGDISNKVIATVKDPNKADVTLVDKEFVASILGTYFVTYSVTNSAGYSANKDYHFECKDYVLTLTLPEESDNCYEGSSFTIPSATASDPVEGDLSSRITYVVKDSEGNEVEVVNGQFTPTAGTYTIIYTITNSLGRSVSKNYQLTAKSNQPQIIPFTITTKYANEVVTLPTAEVEDYLSRPYTFKVEVEDPSKTKTEVTNYQYVPVTAGTYKAYYTATNEFGNVATYDTTFEVKEKFVIAYDNRMYTKGVSGITNTIINNYLTYVKSELDATYDDVVIELQGFDNVESDDADVMADDIIAAGAELTVGFSTSTIGNGAKHIAAIESTECKIAGITKRFIARHSESDLAKVIYNISKTSNGISSLEVKKINVCWFDNGSSAKSPEALRNAVDTALESYFEGLGYNIDVQSFVYKKPSSSTYQDVKDEVIAGECVLGVNWAGNFNLPNGFMFSNARMNSGHTIQGQANRYVISMVRKDDTRAFYNDAFDFLCSAEMDAIYNATY